MVYGLSETGFLPKDLATIKAELEADWRESFGANVEVDAESPDGQIIGIMAEREATLWEQAERVYSSQYLDGASGASLDDLIALADQERDEATKSQALLTLTGSNGTLIPAGSISEESETGRLWVHIADATIPLAGLTTVLAEPLDTGPIPALAGTIDTINTPISGWTGVVNNLDAELGQDVQSDASVRTGFRTGFRTDGSSDEALRAALLALEGVTEVLVISNRTAFVVDGQPAKSLQVVIEGGNDQEILETIWQKGPSGIEFFGTTVSGVVVDSTGQNQDVAFTRFASVLVYLLIEYVAEESAPEDIEDLILAEVLDHATTQLGGVDVVPLKYVQNIETGDMLYLKFNVGLSASPSSDAILPIARTEKARLDSSRIAFSKLDEVP